MLPAFQTSAVQAEENISLDSLQLGGSCLSWKPVEGQPASETIADIREAIGNAFVPPTSIPTPLPSPQGITLAELEALAEQNNPTLAQASARVQAMQGERVQSGLLPNPRVGYQASEIGDEGKSGQQGAFFGQEIVTNGKLQRARDVADQAIQQSQWALEAQRGRVRNDVRRAFYDVLVAQRSIEITDQLVRIGQEGIRSAEQLMKAKEVSRGDVLQAKIEGDTAQILAEKAQNRHQAAWRNLAAVVGANDMQATPLVGDLQEGLPLLAWEKAVEQLLCNSPLLAQARSGVAMAEANLRRQCAERIPNVDLQAGALYDNATSDSIAEVQVGVPLPIFNRNQGNIRKAQAELAAAHCEVRRVELELRQRLAATFEQYQNARCQVEKYATRILPNARTSLELVTAGYRQGEFNYVALLTSQRTFFQVNLAYVDAIRELRAAAVGIEGNLLGDSLQRY